MRGGGSITQSFHPWIQASGIGSSSTFHFQDHSEHHYPTGSHGKSMDDLTEGVLQARHGRDTYHIFSPSTGPNSVPSQHLTAEEAGNVVSLWRWIWCTASELSTL